MVRLAGADLSDASALLRAITRELPGIITSSGNGDWFLFYDPDGVTRPEARFPFTTLVTGDRYDAASNLDRDDTTYRVNLGIGRTTYERLLGPAPRQPVGGGVIGAGIDYTEADTLLPHPYYAPMHWVCIVNPAEQTGQLLADLLGRAHAMAMRQYDHRRRA